MGLGYVGLPLLLACVRQGLAGIGFDISGPRIEALHRAESHLDDLSEGEVHQAHTEGFEFSSDPFHYLRQLFSLYVFPVQLARNRQPDLSSIEAAAQTVSQVARKGTLIVLESTSCPGTTEDFILPAVRSAGSELDQEVFVAFSPQRLSPGDQQRTTLIARVVGGVTEPPGQVAVRLMVGSSRRSTSSRPHGQPR